MKNIFIKNTSLLIVAIVLAISCKKATPASTTNTVSGTTLTGNIEGLVTLYDAASTKQYGTTINTGDSITITNNSNGTIYKTVTNGAGNYFFNNIPTGTYSFTASKPGYGTTKSFGFEFVGGGTAYKNFSLGQTPTTNVTSLNITTSGSSTLLSGTVPTNTATTWVIIYVSIPSQTFANGTFGNYSTYYIVNLGINTTTFNYGINFTNLYNYGFASGDKAYFAAYVFSQNSGYVDPLSGLNIYTALSSTPATTSVTVQ